MRRLDLDSARIVEEGTLTTSAILQFEAWAVMVWSNSAPPPWSVQLIVTPGLASSNSLILALKKSPKSFCRPWVWKVISPSTFEVSIAEPSMFPAGTSQATSGAGMEPEADPPPPEPPLSQAARPRVLNMARATMPAAIFFFFNMRNLHWSVFVGRSMGSSH